MTKKEYMKQWREKNKNKIRAYNAQYQKEYRLIHKDEIREKRKQYHIEHKEALNEKSRVYAREHREEACARAKSYYEAHKDYCIARNKLYKAKAEVKERQKEISKRDYYRSTEMLTTDVYTLPKGVVVIDLKHVQYKGITYIIHKRGYLRSSYNTLHVVLMKEKCLWFSGCEVHHIDGNVLNNSISNLICLTKEQHSFAHKLMREDRKKYLVWLDEIKPRSEKEVLYADG